MRVSKRSRGRRQARQAKRREARRKAREEVSARPAALTPTPPAPPPPPTLPEAGEPEPEPYRRIRGVVAARNYARDRLGIEHVRIVDPSGGLAERRAYLDIINHVLEPLHVLHAEGHEMPRALFIDQALFTPDERMHARFNPSGDPEPSLEVNPDLDLWSEEETRRAAEMNTFSTAHPHGTTYHEYLHFRIHSSSVWMYAILQGGVAPLEAQVQQLAPRVSEYAAASALEFASEVYAALRTGGHFDDEVMHLYRTILRAANLDENEL